MIDTSAETLIPLRQVPAILPPRPSGKRLHVSAVYRWTLRGIKGVVLEAIRVGGTTYTSREALQRFSERLSESHVVDWKVMPTRSSRQRQIEYANRAVMRSLG